MSLWRQRKGLLSISSKLPLAVIDTVNKDEQLKSFISCFDLELYRLYKYWSKQHKNIQQRLTNINNHTTNLLSDFPYCHHLLKRVVEKQCIGCTITLKLNQLVWVDHHAPLQLGKSYISQAFIGKHILSTQGVAVIVTIENGNWQVKERCQDLLQGILVTSALSLHIIYQGEEGKSLGNVIINNCYLGENGHSNQTSYEHRIS